MEMGGIKGNVKKNIGLDTGRIIDLNAISHFIYAALQLLYKMMSRGFKCC